MRVHAQEVIDRIEEILDMASQGEPVHESLRKWEGELQTKIDEYYENMITTYMTDNIYLAAFLLYRGHPLLNVKQGSNKFYFEFENTKELSESEDVYWNSDSEMVNPREFIDNLLHLKGKLN